MSISTHVLDTAKGKPAVGVSVVLEVNEGDWRKIGEGRTDPDGRVKNLATDLRPGIYRLRFDTSSYNRDGFFPEVVITFEVKDPGQHYHVPLLLSPYGYSTYRGS